MTQQRDLKRRIRERMQKTGESYTTARAHVLAERPEPEAPAPGTPGSMSVTPPPPSPVARVVPEDRAPTAIPVVELHDMTPHAADLGLRCRVLVGADALLIDPRRSLERLRDVLLATASDPALALMRGGVLWGQVPRPLRWGEAELHQYLERVRAGIGGPGPGGWMLAFVVDGETLLAMLSKRRDSGTHDAYPLLYLRGTDKLGYDELALAGITLR